MTEDRDEMVRRLQAHADAMRDQPIELMLGSPPGPYITPLCTRFGLQNTSGKVELRLQTDKGHVILVPISDEALDSMYRLVEFSIRPNSPRH